MTREEEILKEAKAFADGQCEALIKPDDEYAFEQGARWADEHPHWISVEDELPPISGWTTSDDVLAVVKVGSDIGMVVLRYDYEVMAWDNPNEVTHWMPLPQAPKKGGKE